MDFKCTEEQEKWRREVRDFLEEELKQGNFTPACDAWNEAVDVKFTKKLAQKGWLGLTWPKEYGGQGRGYMDRLIMTEEILRVGAPAGAHWGSDRQIGRSIIAYGTDEQKKKWLPRMLRGEAIVGIGMSEPEAGSDLANLKTRAVEDGDDYVIDGQKMWTTLGHNINAMYLVARTDPNSTKQAGCSEFIFEIDLPGISFAPTIDITWEEAWNEVFFDGVRIPKTCLIGEKNRGFYQILHQLDFERSGMERLMGNYPLFAAIVKFVKETKIDGEPLCKDTLIRQKLAQLQVEFEVGRLHVYRIAQVMDQGRAPNIEGAMSKAFCNTFEKHLASVATDILGLYGQLWADSKWVPIAGMASDSYLASKGYSLQGGTTEILRNIVAMRGLGLPSGG